MNYTTQFHKKKYSFLIYITLQNKYLNMEKYFNLFITLHYVRIDNLHQIPNRNNKNFYLDLIRIRYNFIQLFSRLLINSLNLSCFVNIDLYENISYKLAGYNVGLDSLLKTILKFKIRYGINIEPIINLPILRHILQYFFEPKTREYEVNIMINSKYKYFVKKKTYKTVYFASMNNYLNSLLPSIKKNNESLLIIPAECKEWLNYKEIKKHKIEHVFIEEIINFNYEELVYIKKKIKARYKEYKHIIFNYLYNLSIKEKLIYKFIFDYLPKHILIINSLDKFLNEISSEDTDFYIARDRRGLENAFIQIANRINGNSNMLIHGMISFDYEKRLWTEGRFKNCKNIFIWGEHDKEVIIKRQQILDEKTPNIIITGNYALKKNKNLNKKYILFICQSFTNHLIKYFSKNLKTNKKVLIRLHPTDKSKIKHYKKYERKNFKIDDLKDDLSTSLSRALLVISYSSTSILEAIYNNIPTLILDFKKIEKNAPSIFKETPIKEEKLSLILINKKNYNKKILEILSNDRLKNRVLEINKKIFNFFIKN